MIFKQGERVDMVVGAVPKTTLANTIEKYLDTKTGSHESENSDNSP